MQPVPPDDLPVNWQQNAMPAPMPIPQLIPKGANARQEALERIGISKGNQAISAGHLTLAQQREARQAATTGPNSPTNRLAEEKIATLRAGQNAARKLMSTSVSSLASAYVGLDKIGAVVSEKAGTERNVSARLRASAVGQVVEGALGTKAQSYRDRIANTRPLLVQSIRQATGMSAKSMDSNAELQFYLQAATDPTKNYMENLAALYRLDQVYGSGGRILQKQLPPKLFREVKNRAEGFEMELPRGARPDEIDVGTIRQSRRTGKREQWNGSAWVPAGS